MFIGFHFGSSEVVKIATSLISRMRRRRRKHVSAAREIFLDDVVLDRAGERRARRALLVGDGDVERHQPRRGGVDGHRRVHRRERDAVEQRAHVAKMADRHADLADLAARQHVVAVVAGLRRQVEGDREAGLALGQVLAVERVRNPSPSNGRRRCGKSRVYRVLRSRASSRHPFFSGQSGVFFVALQYQTDGPHPARSGIGRRNPTSLRGVRGTTRWPKAHRVARSSGRLNYPRRRKIGTASADVPILEFAGLIG